MNVVPRRPRVLLEVAILLLGGVLAMPAQAQMTASTQPRTSATPQELAKSVHNPFEGFVKLPLESTTGFSIGPHHNAGESLNVEPLIPFRVNARWDLITQPSLSVTYQPSPHEQFGLNDLADFVLPDAAQCRGMDLGQSVRSFSSQRRPATRLGLADGPPVQPRR